MFFRILALLPLLSLVTASTLWGRSDVEPVCEAVTEMKTAVIAIQNAYKDFEAQSTKDNAQAILQCESVLQEKMSYGSEVCPTDVLSDSDTELFYQAVDDLPTEMQAFVSLIEEMGGSINAVGFKPEFCAVFQTIVTIMTTFMDKAYACSADGYKTHFELIRTSVLAMMTEANTVYCGSIIISPVGN